MIRSLTVAASAMTTPALAADVRLSTEEIRATLSDTTALYVPAGEAQYLSADGTTAYWDGEWLIKGTWNVIDLRGREHRHRH